ncbi:MAG TPA: polyprenyl diphosphate synthase [Terriglobia bacterium]|nr:polyprenyl diphosphate synthase [Terriglobia bacterium]
MRTPPLQHAGKAPLHVAVIMDGNGRWACRRGLPRSAGHLEGANAVRRAVDAAPALGVGTLTLFAFSGENWQRPAGEVEALMRVFRDYLASAKDDLPARGVRLSVIGRRDRLDLPLVAAAEAAERATAAGRCLHLRLAIDYSARDAILRAARIASRNGFAGDLLTPEAFSSLLAEANRVPLPTPDIDLVIRSGGELRLSDCLLWEIAWAELVFSERLWPDFTGADLSAAIVEFQRRERRFGRVPAPASLNATGL